MLKFTIEEYNQGAPVLVQGSESKGCFYIIREGNVECRYGQGNELPPKMLGVGDYLGMTSCLSGLRQIENGVAATKVSLIKIVHGQYQNFIIENKRIAFKILQSLSHDMRTFNEQYAEAVREKSQDIGAKFIFSVASYYDAHNMSAIALYAYRQYLAECPADILVDQALAAVKRLTPIVSADSAFTADGMIRKYPAGTMVFAEGQSGNDMFIIQDGTARVVKLIGGEEKTLGVLSEGDMLGEMSLLESIPRTASVIADTDCSFLVVNQQNFEQLVETQPQYVYRLSVILAERLWHAWRRLLNAKISDLGEKLVDMLSIRLEEERVPDDEPYVTNLKADDLLALCNIAKKDFAKARKALKAEEGITVSKEGITVDDVGRVIKHSAERSGEENK